MNFKNQEMWIDPYVYLTEPNITEFDLFTGNTTKVSCFKSTIHLLQFAL